VKKEGFVIHIKKRLTEEIVIESKKQIIDLNLKDVAPGIYFVHLFNRKTANSYSEIIIVQ